MQKQYRGSGSRLGVDLLTADRDGVLGEVGGVHAVTPYRIDGMEAVFAVQVDQAGGAAADGCGSASA